MKQHCLGLARLHYFKPTDPLVLEGIPHIDAKQSVEVENEPQVLNEFHVRPRGKKGRGDVVIEAVEHHSSQNVDRVAMHVEIHVRCKTGRQKASLETAQRGAAHRKAAHLVHLSSEYAIIEVQKVG